MSEDKVEEFLSSHPYSKNTKRTYRHILLLFVAETRPKEITAPGLLAWIDRPSWKNSRQQVALAATQKFLKWMYGNKHRALTARIKREPPSPQRALTPDTALKLLASFDRHTATGARDLAICSLALDTGLRLSELCRLKRSDLDLQNRTLQVIVKGGQWAAAVISPQTAAHVEHWYQFGKTSEAVFCNTQTSQPLTPGGLQSIVRQWGKRIEIKLSPHDLRRSFATIATMMGAPERILMDGGRWKHSDMIHRYTRTLTLEAMRPYLPMEKLIL